MRYVLDTNVLLLQLRLNEKWFELEHRFRFGESSTTLVISVVTVGELKAIAKRNSWGKNKMRQMEELFKLFLVADINNTKVIDAYAEIDAFSQGKLKERPLRQTARNMGKNDLWIAATATVLNATLLTMDKDFEHLHSEFCTVAVI
jgi:predicted nucleic acid-binding protein